MLTRWYQTPSYSAFDWNRPLFRARLFDDVFDTVFAQVPSVSPGPRFTQHDTGAEIVLRAEVPGCSEQDLQISFEKGSLTIRGERKIEVPEGYRSMIRERVPVRFSRTFTLSTQLGVEKAEARIENGVLTLTVPRRPESQPRQIPIKTS